MNSFRISCARVATALIAVALLTSTAIAQTRGSGRITGKVLDEQGQPVQDAIVKAVMNGQTEVISGKSDKKGEWRVNGVADGVWSVEISKAGVGTVKEMVEVKGEHAPPLNVTLKKGVAPAAAEDPTPAVNAELQKAAELAQAGKFAEARQIYTDLLAKYPLVYQLEGFMARVYAAEGDYPHALEHLKVNLEKDPNNVDLKMFQAELLMQTGDKAGAKTILDAIDITQVKDPFTFINQSIILINEGKGQEAVDLLTKLIAQFPAQNNLYYYRGRAYVAAQKLPEARADFEKFIAAEPNAKETADAKKILDQIKAAK
jgi:tetratricopeptide (TPR) repeat protein